MFVLKHYDKYIGWNALYLADPYSLDADDQPYAETSLDKATVYGSSCEALKDLTNYCRIAHAWFSGLHLVRIRLVHEPRYEEVETL